ncbi:MAG: hypothetical protein U1E81_17905 [Xanthobacteraceae bacterium]
MGVATPVIMGAALAAQAVGGAVSAYGTYKAGEANAAAANYQAQVAQNNAVIARDNARYASETGESEAYRLGLVNRHVAARSVPGRPRPGSTSTPDRTSRSKALRPNSGNSKR